MKRILAAAAIAAVVGLTACTPGPAPVTPSATTSESAATAQTSPSDASSSAAAAAGDVKEACESFNTLYAEYKALPGTDPNAYEDIYLKAQDAKDTVSGDLMGLFTSLSALAMDHSSVAAKNGQPGQASKDAVRDAVFANAGTCTAEGVTLRL